MKFILIAILGGLIGCGKGGSSATTSTGLPTNLPPTCKSLFSQWTSTTDSETWDFSSLQNEVIESEFAYLTPTNTVCGFPSQNWTAQITTSTIQGVDWQIEIISPISIDSACNYYVGPGSQGNKYIFIMMKMTACGELSICQNYGSGTCKTFN